MCRVGVCRVGRSCTRPTPPAADSLQHPADAITRCTQQPPSLKKADTSARPLTRIRILPTLFAADRHGPPRGWLQLFQRWRHARFRDPAGPPTTPPCQRPLVGRFVFSAKFICMGKQKNRLTAVQTIYQHAQRNPSPQGRPHHISHSAKPPGLPWSFNILLVQPRAVQGRPPDSGNSRKSPRLPCSPRQEITGKFIRQPGYPVALG